MKIGIFDLSLPVSFQDFATRPNLGARYDKAANYASRCFASARESQVGRTLSSVCSNKWTPVVVMTVALLVIYKLYKDKLKLKKEVEDLRKRDNIIVNQNLSAQLSAANERLQILDPFIKKLVRVESVNKKKMDFESGVLFDMLQNFLKVKDPNSEG